MTVPAAQKYFCNECTCLFRWTDEGRELSWANGITIAFHEEISVALKVLSKGNLPSFVPLVLSMAVSRDSWDKASRSISLTVEAIRQSSNTVFAETVAQFGDVLESWPDTSLKLQALHQYLLSQPRNPIAKAEILSGIFHRFESSLSAHDQNQIYEAFRAGLPLEWLRTDFSSARTIPLPTDDNEQQTLMREPPLFTGFARDFIVVLRAARMLATCIRTQSTDDIDHLIRTGIDPGLEPAPPEALSQSLLTRCLLDELRDDPQYAGFAELTRHLMAAFSLPGLLRESTELPVGGVSDLSNRGTLDRLLLSELALDDLTLATRLALNEALFLKREVPPAPQAQSRAIVLDNSLPAWGVPRLYIAALGLAIQGLTPDEVTVQCFRPRGTSVRAFELLSKKDLEEHLEHLEAAASPEKCLPNLVAQLRTVSQQAAPVLITVPDVYENPEFRKRLDELVESELWVILAERTGVVTILHKTAQGSSVKKKIELPLESILANRTAEHLINDSVPTTLPAIMRQACFPMRLAHNVRPCRVWAWGSRVVTFADDGRLMLWTSRTHGAIQLYSSRAFQVKSRIHLIQRKTELIQFLVVENPQSQFLVSIHDDDGVLVKPIDTRLTHVTDVVLQEEYALVFGSIQGSTHERCSAIDLTNQQSDSDGFLAQFQFDRSQHSRVGRICHNGSAWCVLTYLGGVTKWVLQVLPNEFQKFRAIAEVAKGAFLYLDSQLRLGSSLDTEFMNTFQSKHRTLQFRGFVSPQCVEEGSPLVLLITVSPVQLVCIDWRSGERQHLDGKSLAHRTGSIEYHLCTKLISTRTAHYRFTGICILSNRGMHLIGSRQGRFEVQMLDDNQIMFREVSVAQSDALSGIELQQFGESMEVPGLGITLQRAEFRDGSLVWLDSRGLMHLKSSDTAIPEITLVMTGRKLSGWLSTSAVFGDDYYCETIGNRGIVRISSKEAWDQALGPFLDHIVSSASPKRV